MNVVRVILGLFVLASLVSTQPALSASSASDPDPIYTLRVERGKSNRVQFRLIEPRGDSVVEAEHFDFIVTRKGLVIKPGEPTIATGTAGQLTFENFELFLPADGSEPFMEGDVPTK